MMIAVSIGDPKNALAFVATVSLAPANSFADAAAAERRYVGRTANALGT